MVDEGSTAAPSAEEVTEPTEPEPIEQPVMEPAAEAPEPKAPEPEPLSDKAQHLLSSGKEVWAATVSQRTVLFEHVRNVNWGVKQPDISWPS